jgi:hypothetical protein
MLLDHGLRRDRVADRLRHLAAILVDDEAVRQHLAEGRVAARAETDQERAMKPPTMLVAALEVHIRRPRQLRAERQDRLMARPRVEPDVEDVFLALEGRSAARWATEPGGGEVLDWSLVPGVRAEGVEHRCGALDERRGEDRLAARGAVNSRNRDAPGALPRHAPIGTVRQHVGDALSPPRRDPGHLSFDAVERALT